MANPQFILLGKDLFDLGYLNDLPTITEEKGFGRGKIIPPDLTCTLRNTDNQFSCDNQYSFLYDQAWLYAPAKYIDRNGITIFDGIVSNLPRDHEAKTAILKARDILFQNRKTPIEYTSSDWETPATAVYNIMIQEGLTDINYDSTTLQKSISKLESAACYVKVNFLKKDNISLLGATEKLARFGCADIWTHNNKIYYQHWQAYTGNVSLFISEKDMQNIGVIDFAEDELINDYETSYEGDANVPATDTANNNIAEISRDRYGTQKLDDLKSGSSAMNQIAFKDITSAVYISECYINRSNYLLSSSPRPLQKFGFQLKYDFEQYVEIGAYVKITLSDEGWDDKVFEVFSITKDEKGQTIDILVYEVIT